MAFDYNGAKWEATRKRILRRDSYQCRICRRYGRHREATVVHHLKPVETHPELAFTAENLVSLCHSCHNKQHPEKGLHGRRSY